MIIRRFHVVFANKQWRVIKAKDIFALFRTLEALYREMGIAKPIRVEALPIRKKK